MPSVNTINPQTKNSLPTFVQTKYENLVKGLADKKVQPPIFGFLSDLECMVYVSPDGTIYKILVDRINEIEHQLDGLKDPETGKPIKVTEAIENSKEETIIYTDEKIAPVQNQVEELKESLGTINVVI